MASSSSSSHFITASVSQSWNHDVFLSFRGEDTRKGFVDHLYTALLQQGIHTYKDDETLARGESIGPALLKAIQEARIAVIVFSKNYADSSWCLDELAYIIECMDKRGQIVMPVFYDIDPSDVRKQNGKYGEAFSKHEWENNKHKTKSWRKALVKAGNLSGWVPKDFGNGHEAKCIKDIVATISSRISPLIENVNKDLVGLETRLQDLKSKLEIGSGGVRMVGIWGVGGGGKTTLASAAYMEISHLFKACCLLENIREESSKHGLTKLQEKFLSLALKTNEMVGSEIEGRSMIKRRLCRKSVLLVLDDVTDLRQLEALAGSHDWFGEGSRIIITTRDEHLLTRHTDAIYEVSLLSHDEAIKLFSRHAYRKDDPVEDYEMLSQDVVSYAGGLPLALEILGSFLYDKTKDEWKSALAKLKCIPYLEVTERLKISYDGLRPEEKELFLDIACFMRRWKIDEAMIMLNACSFYPGIGVKVLVQKSLIKVSDGVFDMHDLVEEMAHYIVIGDHPNNPEKHCRIWKEDTIKELCSMGADAPLMENEVLALPRSYQHPCLPHVVANMKKIRWIELHEQPESSFPTNFQPTKLGCLMLIRSHQMQLWEGYKHLPNLKILDLEGSFLVRTPDFNGLPCLERLILQDCCYLKEIHPSLGYHERIVYVNMRECVTLKTFPPIIRTKKLETLILSGCSLRKFPDIQTNMDSLASLDLSYNGIEIAPPSVAQFCTNLASFDLSSCEKLKRIEGNFRLLKHLKDLNLDNCSKLLSQHFHQDNSVSLKFPQCLRFLRKLNLSRCNLGDEDIPADICELLNLQLLDLSGNNFSRLHSALSQIPCLKLLNLSHCKSLVELPDLPSSIAILIANWCDSLESIGDVSNYKWLWKVSILRNNKLIGDERVVHSMLQGNAVEDRFMSLLLAMNTLQDNAVEDCFMSILFPRVRLLQSDSDGESITLQLPPNWYSDFSGFLLCGKYCFNMECIIVINKHDMLSMGSQPDNREEFDQNLECGNFMLLGYIPFGSLRQTSRWNPTSTNITFEIQGIDNSKVGLVPRKGKSGASRERSIDCSECWEEDDKDKKTFEIIDDSKSCNIKIVWSHW